MSSNKKSTEKNNNQEYILLAAAAVIIIIAGYIIYAYSTKKVDENAKPEKNASVTIAENTKEEKQVVNDTHKQKNQQQIADTKEEVPDAKEEVTEVKIISTEEEGNIEKEKGEIISTEEEEKKEDENTNTTVIVAEVEEAKRFETLDGKMFIYIIDDPQEDATTKPLFRKFPRPEGDPEQRPIYKLNTLDTGVLLSHYKDSKFNYETFRKVKELPDKFIKSFSYKTYLVYKIPGFLTANSDVYMSEKGKVDKKLMYIK